MDDACACDTGGDCECFCTAVAAYAQACNELDICVSWRTPSICREFQPTTFLRGSERKKTEGGKEKGNKVEQERKDKIVFLRDTVVRLKNKQTPEKNPSKADCLLLIYPTIMVK